MKKKLDWFVKKNIYTRHSNGTHHTCNLASNIAGAKIEHSSTKCSVKTQGFFLLSLQHHNNGLENIYVFHCSLFNSVPKNILGFKKQCRGICTSCIHYGTNRLIIKKMVQFLLVGFPRTTACIYDIPINHTIVLRHTVTHNKRLSSQTGTRNSRALLNNNLVRTPVV